MVSVAVDLLFRGGGRKKAPCSSSKSLAFRTVLSLTSKISAAFFLGHSLGTRVKICSFSAGVVSSLWILDLNLVYNGIQ